MELHKRTAEEVAVVMCERIATLESELKKVRRLCLETITTWNTWTDAPGSWDIPEYDPFVANLQRIERWIKDGTL